MLRYGFLLFDGFSNMCLASAIEPLRAANGFVGQRKFDRLLVTMDGAPVASSSEIRLQPDSSLPDCGALDILFVIAGYGYARFCDKSALGAIRQAARRSRAVAGLDTGSWLLAKAGLLDGHRATIHWQELDSFEEEFPTVLVSTDRFVIDRNRISAGGATTALDLMLRLIRETCGQAVAFDVMNLFIYDAGQVAERPQRGARSAPFAARAPKLVEAIRVMEGAMEEPVSIPHIAGRIGCSTRYLERLFVRELDMPPGKFYQALRLKAARRLVQETGLSIAEISVRAGFQSGATLSRAYRDAFGVPPSQHRRARLKRSD